MTSFVKKSERREPPLWWDWIRCSPIYRSTSIKKAYEEFGETLEGAAEAVWQYNKGIVDAVYDLIPAVKPQIAMYEQFGIPRA